MKLSGICLTSLTLVACQLPAHSASQNAEGNSVAAVYERVHTSVVTIQTVGQSTVLDNTGAAVMESGIGSGVLISDDGRIITAAHVVQTADLVKVQFADGSVRKARILGTVPIADLALLQVIGKLPKAAVVVPLADSDKARIGSQVFVIGSPLGIEHTLTVGYLSAHRVRHLPLATPSPVGLLQTDAAINKGNSGGPLFNMQGEVLGIVSHIASKSGGNEGLGFAVGSNAARLLLLERGTFWSGIETVRLVGPVARAFNLPAGETGALIQTVAKGSMGDRIGLRGGDITAIIEGQKLLIGGDILLEVMGIDVADPAMYTSFQRKLELLAPDDQVTAIVLREGAEVILTAKLGELVSSN